MEETRIVKANELLDEKHTTTDVVDEAEQEMLARINTNSDFQKRNEDVLLKAVNAELEKREIIVLNQEQQNELAKLQLKLNKRTMREEAKAKHYERKRKAKMLRYGYLYTPYEVEVIDPDTNEVKKETRYKNFTTNEFINKYKEFANFYANLADSTKKIITKTIKILIWSAIIAGVIFGMYKLVKWLLNTNIATVIDTAKNAKIFNA